MVVAFGLSLIVDLMVESFVPELRRPVFADVQETETSFEPDPDDATRSLTITRPVLRSKQVGFRDHPVVSSLKLMLGVICCYLSVSFVLQTKDDFRFMIPYVEFSKDTRGGHQLLLDTSVIIDGRITDIAETRILDAEMIVPGFVLRELHTISDSADKLKRNRGRRGLDVLNKLQMSSAAHIKILDTGLERGDEGKGVDDLLVDLADKMDGYVVTTDYNLNKIAQLRGVTVVNINDLANALKPVFIPGETMSVKILKPGEGVGQGVGYLDDGTMVVVEAARDKLGEVVQVSVTSVLQTSAGRMIFGRPEGTTQPPKRLRSPQNTA
ncbi:MAG: TRAM domain-containing protein [bacterium]|nr:TRAM domain-containing protein [bacterium]